MPPELHLAGVYRRRVQASLARVWENVYDWEHLPALHEGTFGAVALVEARGSDWTVRYASARGGAEELIRLDSNRDAGWYRVTTLEGAGVGSEIRVRLTSVEPHVTDVEVQYHVPEARPQHLARIGAGFIAVYERLWDEDEAMMRARESALQGRKLRSDPQPVKVGRLAQVEAALPLTVEVGGQDFRVVRDGDELLAHAALCPHWLGPLDAVAVEGGAVRCPWHGWRFDVRTGANLDGRACALPPAPRVSVEGGEVWLRP